VSVYGNGGTSMSTMRQLVSVLAVVVCLVGLAGIGVATYTDSVAVQNNTTASNESVTAADQPGASVAAAVGQEQSTLEAERQTESVQIRLDRANSEAERAAVLESLATELTDQLRGIESRQEQLRTANLSLGERLYHSSQLVIETESISQLSERGKESAETLSSSQAEPLRTQFDNLSQRSAAVDVGAVLSGNGQTPIQPDTDALPGDGLGNDSPVTAGPADGLNDSDEAGDSDDLDTGDSNIEDADDTLEDGLNESDETVDDEFDGNDDSVTDELDDENSVLDNETGRDFEDDLNGTEDDVGDELDGNNGDSTESGVDGTDTEDRDELLSPVK